MDVGSLVDGWGRIWFRYNKGWSPEMYIVKENWGAALLLICQNPELNCDPQSNILTKVWYTIWLVFNLLHNRTWLHLQIVFELSLFNRALTMYLFQGLKSQSI